MKKLLDYDPLLGRRRWFIHDPLTRQNHIHTEWDGDVLNQILDVNKAKQNADDKGWSRTREMRRVASIPFAVLDIWRGEGIRWWDQNHAPAVKAKLNDPQFRHLRTAPGRL